VEVAALVHGRLCQTKHQSIIHTTIFGLKLVSSFYAFEHDDRENTLNYAEGSLIELIQIEFMPGSGGINWHICFFVGKSWRKLNLVLF